jgi:soluble lytic murein transglycosylase-like protein
MAMVAVLAAQSAVPARAAHADTDWPQELTPVLSASDARIYKQLFGQAREGHLGSARPKDSLLMAHVQAELYTSPRYRASYNELKGWLARYGDDYPQAVAMYRLALDKRPMPKRVCKGKKKHRTCHTVGKAAAPPPVPLAIRKREAEQAAAERRRAQEYSGMDAEQANARRKLVSQSWRLRTSGKFEQDLDLLERGGTRAAMGDVRWQNELVWIADAQLSKLDWSLMRRAAQLAVKAQGPMRDDGYWWLGLSSYRQGDTAAAAKAWREVVRNEPITGPNTARAAWWAARAFTELGDADQAREMLRAGSQDTTSFYGILCAQKSGKSLRYNWSRPTLDPAQAKALTGVRAARRALALAQIGEVALAQLDFRLANEDIPSGATETLAAVALDLHLPATALQMGKTMLDERRVWAAALYPEPDQWQPNGPSTIERPLLLAIMRQESAFHPRIGSRVGAQGLMQLMPATARFIVRATGQGSADRWSLFNPGNNMTLGQNYLAYLQGQTGGNLIAMIAAYNGGLGHVRRWLDKPIARGNDPMMFIESIPFDETRLYVQKVLANLWVYESRLGRDTWSLASLANNRWPQRDMVDRGNGNGGG